jgi:hypothetical protein
MSVETISYWNSQYIFDTIGLGEKEQDEFLKNFEAHHTNTAMTMVFSFKFFTMLADYLEGLDDKKPLEELKSPKHFKPGASYVNVSF